MSNADTVAGFQERLRQAIKTAGITSEEASRASGMHASSLRNLLAPMTALRYTHSGPKLCTIVSIANGLDVCPRWLAFGAGE